MTLARLANSALLVAVCLTLAQPARADAEQGRRLTEEKCLRCHEGGSNGGVWPEFAAVANRPEQTQAGILAWLRSAPRWTPEHQLTAEAAGAIADYILTLRKSGEPDAP